MELVELIRKARSVQCSDLHITAGDFVAVRRFGELKLLDIKPTIEETEKMLFDILNDEDINKKMIKIKDNVTKEEVTINEDELVDYINMNM